RAKRGTKSRPTVRETITYRTRIDELMCEFLEKLPDHPQADTVSLLVRLGLEHEMQHQELLVYDIKHLLCDLYKPNVKSSPPRSQPVEGMAEIQGGLFWLGFNVETVASRSRDFALNDTSAADETAATSVPFAFDNEKSAHQVFLQDFAIDRAL